MSPLSPSRLGAALFLGAVLTFAVGGVSAADDGPEDFPLQAQVTTTPANTGSGSGSGTGTVRHGSGSSSDDGSTTEVADPEPTPSASPDPGLETSDGIIAVGGLRTSYTSAGNPFDGTLHVEVTVQNLSTEVMAPTIAYSLTNVFGVELSEQHERTLGDIPPGGRRTSQVDLTGVGQWGMLGLHMTLTPPGHVDGVEVNPVIRDRWQLIPPWYLVAGLALALSGVAIWRRATRAPVRTAAVGVAA